MSALTVRDLTPAFGAEIEGLPSKGPLDDDTVRQLRQLFDERSVLVFRDLDIDEDYQRELVFSVIGEDPKTAVPTEGNVPFFVSNREDNAGAPYGRLLFHCDTMWAENPQPVISLYGVEVGQPSVPTMFVSMGDAWDRLPDAQRARVEPLQARHGFEESYPNRGGDEDVIDSRFDTARSTITPVAHHHPRTGRQMLYVSQQVTIEITDLDAEANEALLEELFQHLYDDSKVLRHDWRAGDLVLWDNVAVQHARGNVDLEGPERTLRKVVGPLKLTEAERTRPTFGKLTSN